MEQYRLMVFLVQFQLDCYFQVYAEPRYVKQLNQKLKMEADSVKL